MTQSTKTSPAPGVHKEIPESVEEQVAVEIGDGQCAGEAAAMSGLTPVRHGSDAMRGRRAIAGGRRAIRQVFLQAALAAACHNSVLKPVANRLTKDRKPHKVVILAIARRLITIANAILKTGEVWRQQVNRQTPFL